MLPREVVEELGHDALIAVEHDLYRHQDAYDILHHLHGLGLCVSFRKPAHNLRTLLDQYNKPHAKIARFIDTISKQIGSQLSLPHAVYLSSHDLNELAPVLESEVSSLPLGERFVVMDGLHDLNNLFSEQTILQFLNFTHDLLRRHRTKMLVFYDPEKMPESIRTAIHKKASYVVTLS